MVAGGSVGVHPLMCCGLCVLLCQDLNMQTYVGTSAVNPAKPKDGHAQPVHSLKYKGLSCKA